MCSRLCVVQGLLCVVQGLLCVVLGLLCVVQGLLCVVQGLLYIVQGLLCVVLGLLCVVLGLLCVVQGLLCVVQGLLYVVLGLLYVVQGLLYVVQGLLYVVLGMLCAVLGLLLNLLSVIFPALLIFVSSQAKTILDQVSLKLICIYMGNEIEDISMAMAHVLRNIISSTSNLEKWKAEREKHETARKEISSKLRPYPFLSEKIGTISFPYLEYVIMFVLVIFTVAFMLHMF